jgi:hypothetical protein
VPGQPLDHNPGAPIDTMSPKRCFHRNRDIEDAAIANPTSRFRFSPKDKNQEWEKCIISSVTPSTRQTTPNSDVVTGMDGS